MRLPFAIGRYALAAGLVWLGLSLVLGVGLLAQLQAQEENPPASDDVGDTPDEPASLDVAKKTKKLPPPLTEFKGRVIAQTMHFSGAEWLIRDNREQEERCSLMLANLGLKRGMKICDMGCGNGFYSLKMAQAVGDKGHIYCVDVQPEMLVFLNDRADKQGISNVSPILGTFSDPRLPDGTIDLILLVDVYHEFSYPEQMLAAMRKSLSPNGMIVLVEYRAEDPKVPIKPEHKMTRAQVLKEVLPAGYKLAKEYKKLPWQHMMFFARDDAPGIEAAPAEETEEEGSEAPAKSSTPKSSRKPAATKKSEE